MTTKIEESNKALVLEAFDTLFNKRNYEAAARFWSPNYIQHSAHIEPGREGLFNLVRALPPTLKYQPGVIAADVCRIANGVLAEHWDVLQDEATKAESKSGLPMFGEHFAD